MKYIIILTTMLLSCKGNDVSPSTALNSKLNGGNVFYTLQKGDKGYIEGENHGFVYKELKGKYVWWGCGIGINPTYLLPTLGEGANNTALMTSLCGVYNAANACNLEGYFLPNSQEFNKLYLSHLINNINTYWVSEGNGNSGTSFRMKDNLKSTTLSKDSLYVIAIKSF